MRGQHSCSFSDIFSVKIANLVESSMKRGAYDEVEHLHHSGTDKTAKRVIKSKTKFLLRLHKHTARNCDANYWHFCVKS